MEFELLNRDKKSSITNKYREIMPDYVKYNPTSKAAREYYNRFNDMKRRMNRIMKEAQTTGLNPDGLRIE